MSPLRLGCIVQARLGSTRLPGKALLPLADGRPLLAHVLTRALVAFAPEEIVLATTCLPEDRALCVVAQEHGIGAYCGPVDDVLRRFVRVLDIQKWDACVRLTGDNPLMDPDVLVRCVAAFDAYGRKDDGLPRADYVATSPAFLEGLDVEVVSREALGVALSSRRASDHEHVTAAVRRYVFAPDGPDGALPCGREWLGRLVAPEECGVEGDWGHVRVTVDQAIDYGVVNAVLYELGEECRLADLVALAQRAPWFFADNAHVERNAGLRRSLELEMVK